MKKSEEGQFQNPSPSGLFRSLGLNFSGWLFAEHHRPSGMASSVRPLRAFPQWGGYSEPPQVLILLNMGAALMQRPDVGMFIAARPDCQTDE